MLTFATTPVPHDEAAKLITSKPAVTKDVFKKLPEELQARAFTITGIEDFDVLSAVRDRIADLPDGANWDTVKRDVIAEISPWFNPIAAEKRAELLMRHHAFTAYAAAQAREMDELIDVFPYRQYISTEDSRVRPSHAALNGIILRADHPFWVAHTPPWEWNCRCDVVELTAEDMEEEQQRDGKRGAEAQRVLTGPALKQLENENRLVRGPAVNVDLRTPKQKGGNFEVNVRDLNMNYDDIQKRWDNETREEFESWADDVDISEDFSLLGWLTGKAKKLKPSQKVKITPPSNRKSPVSKVLSIDYKRRRHVNIINEAINEVDAVHDDGVLPALPIKGSSGKSLGIYSFGNGVERIAIKSTGPWPRLTTAHEIGHFLDFDGIGTAKTFNSQDKQGILSGVMKSIDSSASIELIKTTPGLNRSYLLDDREKWARAYAQYITTKSKNVKMKAELNKLRDQAPWQAWTDDEFKPIMKEIDSAFNKLGWNPKK